MRRFLGLRGRALNYATILLVVMPAMLCYGYNLSVAGGVLTSQSFVATFPEMDTINTDGAAQHENSLVQGTALALMTVGACFGSLSCIWLGDVLGRRLVIFTAACVTIAGSVLMSASFSLAQFIVSRLVLGVGTGGCTATVPVWQSEISKASNRGAHVVTEGIFIGGGVAVALWIDLGLYFVQSSASWRVPFALEIISLLVVVVFIFTLPESPRWLIKKGRFQEACVIMSALEDRPQDSPEIAAQVDEIRHSFSIAQTWSLWSMFSMGPARIRHRTIIAATAQMFFQISGVNMVTFYTTSIFQGKLNFDATPARILAAAMASCQAIGGMIAFWLIDRNGRRQLMLVSASGMTICMSVLAGTTAYPENQASLIAAAVFLYLYNLVYPIGFLGLPLLYTAEVSPLHLRAAISGFANAVLWLFNFLVVEVTPVAFNQIGYRYYIVYAVFNAVIVITVYFCFPETNGLSLEEMNQVFQQSRSILDPPRIARKLTICQGTIEQGELSSKNGATSEESEKQNNDVAMASRADYIERA